MARVELVMGRAGGLVEVLVGAPAAYTNPSYPPARCLALVDTGAELSAVSPRVVAATMPPHLGAEFVGRAGGIGSVHPTYLVGVRPGVQGQWLEVEAVEIEPASEGVEFILGRDLLRRMVLHWDGPAGNAWIDY